MNQNKNTPCDIHQNFGQFITQQGHGPSIFNFLQSDIDIIEENNRTRKEMFSAFIATREHYLDGLKTLGDNWISGTSKQPTNKSIELSKSLLHELGNWYATDGYQSYVYPKILMSPTPSGGIAIEVDLFPNLCAYISILDDNINYEVEQNGHFSEYEANKKNIGYQLLTLYKRDERGHYSRQ